MTGFARSTTHYASFEWRYDADGKVWAQAQAHDTLVAKTVYKIIVNEFGQITAAQADDVLYYLLGVPEAAAASGDIVWLQIGGYIADMICPSLSVSVGHALTMTNGASVDSAADYTGAAGQFFVCATATTTATTITGQLVPKYILGTT